MTSKAEIYIPRCFQTFQDFLVIDIKEYARRGHMELILEKRAERKHHCWRCGTELGAMKDRYRVRAKHLRVMLWSVSVVFWREKRWCGGCKKVRSERIEFMSPTSPHVTLDLAWWLSRLSEITSVLSVSKLESLDKEACYRIDKFILTRLLQGYRIPQVTHIAVDEVYARGPKQLKEGENRDDLFLTVIVDIKTHKVIWVSKSRKKEALDEFFMLFGRKACRKIKVVSTDQHEGYGASIREHCPNAIQVWDRFHLVQNFNEALNNDRRQEYANLDPESKNYEDLADLMRPKYKYIYLTKKDKRSDKDQAHFEHVAKLNEKIYRLELIKEHFHKLFDCQDPIEAQVHFAEVYEWAFQASAWNILKWVMKVREEERFWNYFKCKVSNGVSEGINRVIKGLKWQAYGYKDMQYFALKILQKAGYLNSRYHGELLPTLGATH